MGVIYRLRQFASVVATPRLPTDAWPIIKATLSLEELALFRRHAEVDRVHSFRVLRTLQEAGETEPHLLAAALLHDVGKSRVRPTLWDRVTGSLGERFFPKRVPAWATGGDEAWRRPFVIRQQHATWGAQMARDAGSHPTTVRLIRYHQSEPRSLHEQQERLLLQRLQWADDQN